MSDLDCRLMILRFQMGDLSRCGSLLVVNLQSEIQKFKISLHQRYFYSGLFQGT
jgi:hypothetical protein